MTTVELNLMAGWSGIAAGFVSGMVFGLRFYEDGWLGGYASFRRRMLRLGHIAFAALGLVNIALALSISTVAVDEPWQKISSLAFIVGLGTMPLCCFLSAWKQALRSLFPVPVVNLLVGVGSLLVGWGLA